MLVGCHPPEMTTVKISAVNATTNSSIDSIKCSLKESGVELVQKYTVHGQTQFAFEMRSNRSYDISVENGGSEKYLQVENSGFPINLGSSNEYNLKFIGYGNLDLGLKTTLITNSSDYLIYQLVHLDHYEVSPISKGWSYGEQGVYGQQDNPHFINYELPAGNYRLEYRIYRNGYFSSDNVYITIEEGQTEHFVLNY